MKAFKKIISFLLALAMILSLSASALAVSKDELEAALTGTGEYILKTVKKPQVGQIGGEWAVLGLARSGMTVPEGYFENYYATVEEYIKACKGVVSEKKYTEYARLVVALASISKDPTDVAGYNLLMPLADYDKTLLQGLSGPIWALIALDAGSYDMPQNPEAKTQATRQMYIDTILDFQLPDGGFNLTGSGYTDTDMTAMALQALAKYQSQDKVREATEKAVETLAGLQDEQGGFASWGITNLESVVQVLIALTELGIDANDPRFIKNGHSMLDNIFTYRKSDGSFFHLPDGKNESNQMATEQAFYGMVAAMRALEGKSSLYRMNDAISIGEAPVILPGTGLEGKHPDVKFCPITEPGKSFPDLAYDNNLSAIEALASRGIISGMNDGNFYPAKTMTRAEFATIVTKSLGLEPAVSSVFSDVPEDKWYAPFVGTANRYGIVSGVGGGKFNPEGTITREQAATMVANAAVLCGMDTEMPVSAVRDVLSQFGDYVTVSSWAQAPMAFCYDNGILGDEALDINPREAVTRSEIAAMLFNLLLKANLL